MYPRKDLFVKSMCFEIQLKLKKLFLNISQQQMGYLIVVYCLLLSEHITYFVCDSYPMNLSRRLMARLVATVLYLNYYEGNC